MAARLESAARHLCKASGWKLSNLQLQKMLYIAQMNYMGKNDGRRLAEIDFEAWDNGPVCAELYHKLKAFGSSPVKDVFSNALNFESTDPRGRLLTQVCQNLINERPGTLIELTHWDKGAWATHYVPGLKSIRIPDRDIIREYKQRIVSNNSIG